MTFNPDCDLIEIAWPTFEHGSESSDFFDNIPSVTEYKMTMSQDLPLPPLFNDLGYSNHNDPQVKSVSIEQIVANDAGSPTPHYQPPRHPSDMYTPTWTRGSGATREGRCTLCTPPVWLRLKQSAYWYHLNYVHGISATTGVPYPEPSRYRLGGARSCSELVKCEGWCGECGGWKGVGSRSRIEISEWIGEEGDYLDLDNVELDYKVLFPHTNWYKHCQKQHRQ